MWAWRCVNVARFSFRRDVRRFSSTTTNWSTTQSKTRNIGIIAHIDAGKTTTTERMLYYSGHTRRIGDVDDGSTVTDFLPAERARGITIQSAAITFNWPPGELESKDLSANTPPDGTARLSSRPHNINLIDTPGHADFTFEVLRSLRVLDGAVCILDGVAGVEAQTEKVWTQASHYQIPRIIFVNKLDRDGAAFHRTIKEIGTKLHVWPAICGIPWWRLEDKRFCGIGDVVGLRALLWEEGSDGRLIKSFELAELEKSDPKLAQELKSAREALIERLSEHDEIMVEKFFEHEEDHLAIPEIDIVSSLRRCTLSRPQQVAPVYAGASFRNIGVQPLLDAVIDLLPSPIERPEAEIRIGNQQGTLESLFNGKLLDGTSLEPAKPRKAAKAKSTAFINNLESCALAFKVVNDPKRGVLVYVRVYAGSLVRGSQIFNTNLNVTEKAPRLLKMYASDAADIQSIEVGQIGVIVGLKHARTGDTLLSYTGMNPKSGPPAPLDSLQLRPISVPPPVFFTSIEPESLAEEKQVRETLGILLREDPSLNVTTDEESGQTQLAGMGELHLEIARDRLINEFKAKARAGKIDINYREAVEAPGKMVTCEIDRDIGGKHAHATCAVSIKPLNTVPNLPPDGRLHELSLPDSNHLIILHPSLTTDGEPVVGDRSPFPPQLTFSMVLASLRNGVSAGLSRGPSYGFPVHSARIVMHLDPESQIFADTSAIALSVAAREAIQQALESARSEASFALMEPVMHVSISVDESDMGGVVHDLTSSRGGQIISLDDEVDPLSSSGSGAQETLTIDSKLVYAPPDPYSSEITASQASSQMRQITARVPLREMVGYLRHLRSLTGGRSTFVMQVDRFEKVTGSRLSGIMKEIRGGTLV